MEDLISRKVAIDALMACKGKDPFNRYEKQNIGLDWGIEALKQLPSAQPETHDKRTKTHSCDCVSRQVAIDAIENITSNMSVCINSDECHGMKRMQRQAVIELANLPSAQPEPCEDAVSREEAKWVVFCNRDHVEDQANAIDALPPVTLKAEQPDLSEYSDKLWRNAYERGKAEAQRKKGKWLPDNNSLYEMRFVCSECHESEVVPTIGFTKYKPIWDFCPNCGADMREPEDIPMEYFESGGKVNRNADVES